MDEVTLCLRRGVVPVSNEVLRQLEERLGRVSDGGELELPASLANFTSLDESVAVVAGPGLVWAKAEGTVAITASNGTFSAAALTSAGTSSSVSP